MSRRFIKSWLDEEDSSEENTASSLSLHQKNRRPM